MKNFLADIMMKSENPDLFEYILYKKLHDKKSTVKKEEGVPPLTFTSSGFPLNSYEIFGNFVNGDGVGERTKNLLPLTVQTQTINGVTFTTNPTTGTVTVNGTPILAQDTILDCPIPKNLDGDFYLSGCPDGGSYATYDMYAWDSTASARVRKWDGTTQSDSDFGQGNVEIKLIDGHTTNIRIRTRYGVKYNNLVFHPMIRVPSASSDFEPYGYKIPVSCGGETTTIYIGENPLRKALDDSVFDELSSEGIIIRRVDDEGTPLVEPITETVTCPVIDTDEGSNTFDVDTTLTPSKVIIYHT